jgi:hypothetical protein
MDINTLLNNSNNINTIFQIGLLSVSHDDSSDNYPKYLAALENAVKHVQPEFEKESYGELFREAAVDPSWFAESLMTNAEREGDGATRLWSMAACCPDIKETELLKRHAVDESRHSTIYLKLLDLTFPDAVDSKFRAELEDLSPHYTNKQELFVVKGSDYARVPSIDEYIQMNIAEIRTAMHHIFQRESLKQYCPEKNLEKVLSLSTALLKDELYHVAYTAKLIEEKATEDLSELFTKRIHDFNEITKTELSQKIFD